MKYEYKKVKGYDQKKFIENGHTMFEEDVLQRLKRLAYLEEQLQQANGLKSEKEKALHIHGVSVNEADYCSNCSLKHKAPDKDKLKIIAADGSEVAVCKFTRACLFKGSIKYCRTNNKKCEHSVLQTEH